MKEPITIIMRGDGFNYTGTIDLAMAALILQAIGIEQEKARAKAELAAMRIQQETAVAS